MSDFKGYKALVQELSKLTEKLESGSLSKEEMNTFCEFSKQLNERAIILRYKALESEVYSTEPTSEKVEEPKEQKAENKTDETKVEADTATNQKESEEELEAQESDVDISETKQEDSSELFSFDFSEEDSDDTSEVKQETKAKQSDKEEEPFDAEVTDEVEKPKSKTTVTTEKATHISSEDKSVSFYERFTEVHDESLLAVLSSQKIDSLKGAFGLNDKLQMINELFEGESSKFENAIEELDRQDSSEDAKLKLNQIAAQHQWEPDNRVVESFVKMIERRYAE